MNSFEPQHYVPILRWKEAERGALSQLDMPDLTHITPLIELIPENFVENNKRLPNDAAMYWVGGQLTQCWDERPIYIDLLNLPPTLGPQTGKCLELLARYADFFRLSLIPVTGLRRDASYNIEVRNVVEKMSQGACLRISLEDVDSATLDQSVSDLLSLLDLKHNETDLLIDCRTADSSFPKFENLCRLIPNIHKWRNFIITGGAFPKDLSAYRKNERHSIQRLEWISWRDQAVALSYDTRLPNFSDCTVQHAQYTAKRPGRMSYSASIRYTIEDSWVLMRGENVFRKGGPGFHQYPDLAIMLCDLPQYCGERYSSGDRYIKEISLQTAETGAAPQWLQAGINHHMTFVVRQLASLYGLPTVTLSQQEGVLVYGA
ncbi:beta family protein [Chloroflexota bacterium]